MRVGNDSGLQGMAGRMGAAGRLGGRGKQKTARAREANRGRARGRKEGKGKKRRGGRLRERQRAAGRSPAALCAAEGGQLEGKRRVKVAGRLKADRGACCGRWSVKVARGVRAGARGGRGGGRGRRLCGAGFNIFLPLGASLLIKSNK